MGCLYSKLFGGNAFDASDNEETNKATYSWDVRPRIDPKDFIIENIQNETVGRLPDSIGGQQFIVRDCKDTNIFLFDHVNTISIDDCENCTIFVGPVKTSVFVRDCNNCRVATACQQFRTRDCLHLDVFLACVSQPIIEASSHVRFAPLQINYPQLESQFSAAGMSPFNCEWSDIHDFTPVSDSKNFSLMMNNTGLVNILKLPSEGMFKEFATTVQLDKKNSLIPLTLGGRRPVLDASEESCLVVFFGADSQRARIRQMLSELLQNYPTLQLVRSRELRITPADGSRIFGNANFEGDLQQGASVGVELLGNQAVVCCQTGLLPLLRTTSEKVFISENASVAAKQLEQFYGLINMQMNSQ